MLSVLMIVIDGLADETIPELGCTPLEWIAPRLRALNTLAERGLTGLIYPVAPGVPPSSDAGHLSLFGYDIVREYPGRGFFEALGAGIELRPGVIAFRTNLATVEERDGTLVVVDRRAGRISGEDARLLYEALNEALSEAGIPAKVLHTSEHRGVLVLEGEEFLGAVTDTDPHETGAPVLMCQPWDGLSGDMLKRAQNTAKVINEITKLAYRVLSRHEINERRMRRGLRPANVILIRGGGLAKRIESFRDKWGFRAAFVAGGALYKGIARALGMDEIKVKGATGTVNTNLPGKVDGALKALERGYDFVYLHIKATDSLSHDGRPREKAEFIARIDQALEPVLELEDTVVVVTSDHATSSLRGRHMGYPVPLLLWAPHVRRDDVKHFCERECARGGAGTLLGRDLMNLILDLADRATELGLRPHPREYRHLVLGAPLRLR